MPLWFTEVAAPGHRLDWLVRRVLHSQRSDYQWIEVVDTEQFGPALILDGILQTAVGDEFVYHEMLCGIPMSTHPAPRRVLIVGGGDGGTAREVLRWPGVETVTIVEIDPQVVEVARRWLPSIAQGLDDPRLRIEFADGRDFLAAAAAGSWDVVLVDSTDPEGNGPGQVLYTEDFLQAVWRALADDGMMVQQTGAPFYNPEVVSTASARVAARFPLARVYWTTIPTYPGVLFTFTVGSKAVEVMAPRRLPALSCRWYTPALHRAAFALPAQFRQWVAPEVWQAQTVAPLAV